MNRFVTVLSLLILAFASPPARADIFAAVNVAAPPPRTDLDVAVVNASIGTRVSLPSLVNTTASEVHPSISSDGRRLLFKRLGAFGSSLLLVDMDTSASATLFSVAETRLSPIYGSTLTSDGRRVLTGRRLRPIAGSDGITRYFPVATVTDVSSFPTGPYPRSTRIAGSGSGFSGPGRVADVAVGGAPVYEPAVFQVVTDANPFGALVYSAFNIAVILRNSRIDFGQPALSGGFVFFDARRINENSGLLGGSDILLTSASPGSFGDGFQGAVSTGEDESQPGFTSDGRYFAFVRHGSDGHDRLFVRHVDSLAFLNPNGVDLGVVATRGIGSVSLYERAVLASSAITRTGQVNATLTSASSIGIFVQRIVGKTKVLGRKAYELETVGRVPLGSYGAGNVFTHWDFAVNGEPLAPGRYLVTVRAVEGDVVREFGESQVLTIGKKGTPKGEIR